MIVVVVFCIVVFDSGWVYGVFCVLWFLMLFMLV